MDYKFYNIFYAYILVFHLHKSKIFNNLLSINSFFELKSIGLDKTNFNTYVCIT